jgi:predicted Zn finger-like uncharacterized protein
MLIVCPNCDTSYDVSAASLGAEGRSVRCVRCQEIWFATPSQAPPAGDSAGMVSAAAASAQYQRGAGAGFEADSSDFEIVDRPFEDQPSEDELSVDPNLAARAAHRSAVAYDDPSEIDAGDDVVAMDADGPDPDGALLAEHDAPPLAPDDMGPVDAVAAHEPAHELAHEPTHDIESFAARRARRQLLRREGGFRRPSVATVILLLLAVNAAVLGWRSDVVRLMPQTASLFAAIGLPVNLRGLAFKDVTTTKDVHDGVSVLLVQGTIANVSRQPHDVPRIRFAMRNPGGSEVYVWTTLPARSALAPGDAQPFQTRLASPPAEGRDVVVRFFNRRDAVGGGH